MAGQPKTTGGSLRTGRRPGPNRTRDEILRAARAAFSARGYDAVSVRSIARDAHVDPALVHRFFGSKESVFVAAMELPVTPSRLVPAILAHGPDGLGERVVETLLTLYDNTGAGGPFRALLASAVTNEHAATVLREFVTTEILGRVTAAAAPDQPDLRAALAASQILGLVMARYILRIPHIADAQRSHLAACVGPTVQRYIAGALPQSAGQPQRPPPSAASA
ncbi:MAG: TetR family transcriptional regulator [Solirubrobacteraceae bacterium]